MTGGGLLCFDLSAAPTIRFKLAAALLGQGGADGAQMYARIFGRLDIRWSEDIIITEQWTKLPLCPRRKHFCFSHSIKYR